MEQGIRIRTVILLWLLFSGFSFTNAQQISTVGEIYDYEVGDTFHFDFWATSPISGASWIKNITITNKSYSLNNDTVFYERAIAYQELSINPIIEFYNDTVIYTDLDSLINMGVIDTIYSNPQRYNGRLINGHHDWRYWGYWYIEYVIGCGRVYLYLNDDWDEIYSEEELIYYKKGDEEWGTPHVIVEVEELGRVNSSLKCYPNPFTTSTTIEYELTEPSLVQLSIYNAIGETIYVAQEGIKQQGKHSITWSPESLPEGMYYAVLRSEEGVSVVTMVKQ